MEEVGQEVKAELKEMRALLESHGYDPKHAEILLREGMGPYELEDRLKMPIGVGSLAHTHRIYPSPKYIRKMIAKRGKR